MANSFSFPIDQYVFVDETGNDARDHAKKYGYAIRGVTPQYYCSHGCGQRVNAIPALCTAGVVAVEIFEHTVTGDVFFDFARRSLIPNMLPYIGSNPQSIVIMDKSYLRKHDRLLRLIPDKTDIIQSPFQSISKEQCNSWIRHSGYN